MCWRHHFLQITPPFCAVLFDDCDLELREFELLTFLGCVVVLKNRKQQALKVYLATIFTFAKALSTFLFLRSVRTHTTAHYTHVTSHCYCVFCCRCRLNPPLGFLYILLCFIHMVFLPEPAYKVCVDNNLFTIHNTKSFMWRPFLQNAIPVFSKFKDQKSNP